MQNFKKITKKTKINSQVFEFFLIDCIDKLIQESCNPIKLYSNYEESFDFKKTKQSNITEKIVQQKETVEKELEVNLFDRKSDISSFKKFKLDFIGSFTSKLNYWIGKIPLFFSRVDEGELEYSNVDKEQLFEIIRFYYGKKFLDNDQYMKLKIFYCDSPLLIVFDRKTLLKMEYISSFHMFVFEDTEDYFRKRFQCIPPGDLQDIYLPLGTIPEKCSFSDLKSSEKKMFKIINQNYEVFYKDMFLMLSDEKKRQLPLNEIIKEIETKQHEKADTNKVDPQKEVNIIQNINYHAAKENKSNNLQSKEELSKEHINDHTSKEELSKEHINEHISKEELSREHINEHISKEELSKEHIITQQQDTDSKQHERDEEQKQSNITENNHTLIYKGVDYLYLKRVGDKFISNFSKIEINAKDVNDVQYSPFEIYVRYISCYNDIPFIQISPELNNCLQYSYNNCLITFYVYFNNFIKGNFEYKGSIMINNFVFPFNFKFNIIDTVCYVSIPGLQFSIDQQTQRPFTSFSSIGSTYLINAYDSKFNLLKHQIEVYGNASINENSKLQIKEKSGFGIVIYLSKQNTMYTGLSLYYNDNKDNLEMFYFHPGLRQFGKTDKIFIGFFNTFCYFYIIGYDETKYQMTVNPSKKLILNEYFYKDNILELNCSFKKTAITQVFIEFVFTSEKDTKTFRFEVINPQLEIIENNDKICCRFEHEELNTIPCLYFDFDDNIFKPIKPNEFIQKPKNKFIVLSCFNKAFISYDEPNCQTHINYKYENIYQPNVTNFCFLVLENKNKIRIIKKEEFDPRKMKKICTRLCDFDFDPNNDDNMKWSSTWAPISKDISYINEIISCIKNLNDFYSIFFKFIRLEKPKGKLKNAIIETFKDRISEINSTRGFLRLPMDENNLTQAANSISKVTKFSPEELKMFENMFKENDVIKFTRNNISIINSRDIEMKFVEPFSFDFGDSSTILVFDENRTMDINYAIYLCSFLPLFIKTHSISDECALKLYSELEKYHYNFQNESNDQINEFNMSFEFMRTLIAKQGEIISINPLNVIKNSIPSFESNIQQFANQNSTNYQQVNTQQFINYNQGQQVTMNNQYNEQRNPYYF